MKIGSWLIFEKEDKHYITRSEFKLFRDEVELLFSELAERMKYALYTAKAAEAREARAELNKPFTEEEIMAIKAQLKTAGVDEKLLTTGELLLKSGAINRKTIQDFVKNLMR